MIKRIQQLTAGLCLIVLTISATALAAPAADAQSGESYFVLYGEAGDYITQGADVFHAESADIEFIPSVNFDNGVSVMIDVRENGTFVERWHTNFAAPNNDQLAVDDGFTATRFPFQPADEAGLSVSGDGRGCNMLTGEFLVREITIGSNGEVENFAADFRQSCDGGPAMVGGIRINSLLDNPDPNFTITQPPGDTTPPTVDADLIQTGRIKGTSSNFFVAAGCTDENPGVELVSAEINGIDVSDGQKVKLTLSNRERVNTKKGLLRIWSASITLTVTCTDAAGNTAAASVQPSFVAD